jgi:hypothetical protein
VRSESALKAQQIREACARGLAEKEAYGEAGMGEIEKGAEMQKKETWQGAASRRQRVWTLSKVRGRVCGAVRRPEWLPVARADRECAS